MKKLACLMLLLAGCSSSKPAQESAAQPAQPAAEARPEGKIEAPVDVTLTSTALSGAADLTLTITAKNEIPRAVARFVVPDGVKLVKGTAEQDLGALKSGETRTALLSVDIPANAQGQLAGGVDVFPAGNVKLHRAADVIALGAPAAPKDQTVKVDGENVRMAPAK